MYLPARIEREREKQRKRYTIAVFSRYRPLLAAYFRVARNNPLCANQGDNARAFKISLSLSLSLLNYSYLGSEPTFRISVPAMTNARLSIILSASNKQRRFRKSPLRTLSHCCTRSFFPSLSLSLWRLWETRKGERGTIEIAILAPDIFIAGWKIK